MSIGRRIPAAAYKRVQEQTWRDRWSVRLYDWQRRLSLAWDALRGRHDCSEDW